jgi:hypothetical protein
MSKHHATQRIRKVQRRQALAVHGRKAAAGRRLPAASAWRRQSRTQWMASHTSSRPRSRGRPPARPARAGPGARARRPAAAAWRHAAEFTVADDQQVGAAPARLVHAVDGAFDRVSARRCRRRRPGPSVPAGLQARGAGAQVAFEQFTRAAEGHQRQPRRACAARRAAMTTALAMVSGAPRIEPEVSRHSRMGPRSSASGGQPGDAACGAAGRRVGPPVGQHRLAVPAQQPRFGMARAPELLQHRVAQHHRLAGQHAFDAAGEADAGDLARRSGSRSSPPQRQHGVRGGSSGGGGRGRRVARAFAAAQAADQRSQFRQLGQALAGAARRLPLARTQLAAQLVPAQVARSPRRAAAPGPRPGPGSRLPGGAELLRHLRDGGVAAQPRLQVDDAVQVPEQRAQHLLGQLAAHRGTAPARPRSATDLAQRAVAAGSPKSASAGGSWPACSSSSQRCVSQPRLRVHRRWSAPAATAVRGSGLQVVGRWWPRRIGSADASGHLLGGGPIGAHAVRLRRGRQRPARAWALGRRRPRPSAGRQSRRWLACSRRSRRRARPASGHVRGQHLGGQRARAATTAAGQPGGPAGAARRRALRLLTPASRSTCATRAATVHGAVAARSWSSTAPTPCAAWPPSSVRPPNAARQRQLAGGAVVLASGGRSAPSAAASRRPAPRGPARAASAARPAGTEALLQPAGQPRHGLGVGGHIRAPATGPARRARAAFGGGGRAHQADPLAPAAV